MQDGSKNFPSNFNFLLLIRILSNSSSIEPKSIKNPNFILDIFSRKKERHLSKKYVKRISMIHCLFDDGVHVRLFTPQDTAPTCLLSSVKFTNCYRPGVSNSEQLTFPLFLNDQPIDRFKASLLKNTTLFYGWK